MKEQSKQASLRAHLTMPGIGLTCACVLLAGCALLSLRELQPPSSLGSPTTLEPTAVRLRRLQYAELLSLALLVASAACAAVRIRAHLQDDAPATRTDEASRASVADRPGPSDANLLQSIADALPMRVAYLDRNGLFSFINRSGCERHGLTRAQLLGRPAADFVTALATDRGKALLKAAYSGQAQRFEHNDEFNGLKLRLETHIKPDFDPQGCVRGLFVIGADITAMKEVERSLRDLTDVIESTPDYVAQTDTRGAMKYLNPAARAAVGLARTDSLQGRIFSEFHTPETNERLAKEILPAVRERGVWVGETSVVLQGGRVAPVSQVVIAHRDAQGRVTCYSSLMRDISSEVASRKALSQQTATLSAVIESIPAMVAVVDPQLRYRMVNHAFNRARAGMSSDLIGRKLQEIAPAEFERNLPFMQRALAGENVSYELHFPAGAMRHCAVTLVPLRLEDGSGAGYISVVHDITAQREEKDQLLLLSERDALTGLMNRSGFEKYLQQKVQQDAGYACGLLYIDLDLFKPINDSLGHAAGDEVLREFASRLCSIVRPCDAVARLGGDEFAVVLTGLREPGDAATVAQKVVELARLPFMFGQHVLLLSASVGVAVNADAMGGWRGLVQRADALLYEAKAAGRARLVLEPQSYASGDRIAS